MTIALNPYYQLPVIPTQQQYRMGSSFVPQPGDFIWNTTDSAGNITICAEPVGWESFLFITPIDTVGGHDGGLIGPSSVGPKQLDFSAMIIGSSAQQLRLKVAVLRALVGPRKVTIFEAFDPGTGLLLGVQCGPSGLFDVGPPFGRAAGGEACTVHFSLIAGQPWRFVSGGVAESLSLSMPVDVVSGFSFPITFPFNFGATTNPGGAGIANNQGNINAYPIFTVTGPIPMPFISDDTTGQSFLINATVPSGVTVTIDAQTGVVTPSNYRLLGSPFALAPGANAIRWRATTGTFNAAANLTLTWRSTME